MRHIIVYALVCLSFINCYGQNKKSDKQENNGAKTEQTGRAWAKLPVAEFNKILADTSIQLIDVRTPEEYQTGHIPGARNIDVRCPDFEQQVERLDRKRPVVVYCRSGVRSTTAATKLSQKGFKVYELEKGISSWTGKQEKQSHSH